MQLPINSGRAARTRPLPALFDHTHMKRFEFRLDLSEQQYLHYYRGSVNQVIVKSFDGATIQFPASLLIKFVSTSGVHGRFVLTWNHFPPS